MIRFLKTESHVCSITCNGNGSSLTIVLIPHTCNPPLQKAFLEVYTEIAAAHLWSAPQGSHTTCKERHVLPGAVEGRGVCAPLCVHTWDCTGGVGLDLLGICHRRVFGGLYVSPIVL